MKTKSDAKLPPVEEDNSVSRAGPEFPFLHNLASNPRLRVVDPADIEPLHPLDCVVVSGSALDDGPLGYRSISAEEHRQQLLAMARELDHT